MQTILRNMNNSKYIDLTKLGALTSHTLLILSNKPVKGSCKNKVYYYPKRLTIMDNIKYNIRKFRRHKNYVQYLKYMLYLVIYTIFITFIYKYFI